MTPEEEQEIIKKYFPLLSVGSELAGHTLKSSEYTYSEFWDCELCGSVVHSDQTTKHAQWHETVTKIYSYLMTTTREES